MGKDGITFVEALTIVFVVLKLTGIVDWSWIWVLSPIWITVFLAFSVVAILAIYREWGKAWDAWKKRPRM